VIVAGRKHRRDAEDFGKQTATVELRCDHDNSRIGKGGSIYWVCVHLGDAESPEVPDASFETPKECGKYEEVFWVYSSCQLILAAYLTSFGITEDNSTVGGES